MKKLNYLLTAFTLFFGFTFSVNAAELEGTNTVDFTRKGSIEITLKVGNVEAVKGVELSVYHIANATEENNNLKFIYTEKYKDCTVILDDLTDPNLTKELEKYINDKVANYNDITDENGMATYNDLDLGLYLVKQTNKVKGYSNIDSFLVMLPNVEDNKWIYNIKATPKTDIYREIDLTVNKVWNSKGNSIPNEVTISLLKDNKVIDTVILNKNNNWTYTWKDLEKSDKYKVKEINIPKGYTATYQNDGYIYTVTNTDTLANTGQYFYSIIICATLGMLFILFGFINCNKEN